MRCACVPFTPIKKRLVLLLQTRQLYVYFMYAHFKKGKAVYKNIGRKRYEWWDEIGHAEKKFTKDVFRRAAPNTPIFMNIGDWFCADPELYKKQIGWFHAFLETKFPLCKGTLPQW